MSAFKPLPKNEVFHLKVDNNKKNELATTENFVKKD